MSVTPKPEKKTPEITLKETPSKPLPADIPQSGSAVPIPLPEGKSFKTRIEENLIVIFCGALITGFVAGLGVYKGILTIAERQTVSTEEYNRLKNLPPVTAIGVKQPTPKKMPVQMYDDAPGWVETNSNLLSIEYNHTHPDCQGCSKTEAVYYESADNFQNFILNVDTINSYKITGQAFRALVPENSTQPQTADRLIQPLKISLVNNEKSVRVTVPELNKGDYLIMILRIESSAPLRIDSFLSTFDMPWTSS